uniref:Uncharacterized protein n=1 Tax=Aegilops tauschii subsp. strangulata TaxID=200361 RepID=A0A453NV22_AEGTS
STKFIEKFINLDNNKSILLDSSLNIFSQYTCDCKGSCFL